MKYNLSKIMLKAWKVYRKTKNISFAEALHRAWLSAKAEEINAKRIEESLVTPTLSATPGDLSLVLPKRILDGIIEMIYQLDKIAPGFANDDTLLYGVEVKFYNMEISVDENLESSYKGLYMIGDGSGITHSLSHASASGIFVARKICEENA